jgi:hypothetical protein
MGRNVSSLPRDITTVLSPKGVGVEASTRVSLRSLVQSLQNLHWVVRAEKVQFFLKTILPYFRWR